MFTSTLDWINQLPSEAVFFMTAMGVILILGWMGIRPGGS